MKVFHIGTIALETKETKRELKSIGGISGYIIELINYSLSKDISIGFFGKIYNYSKNSSISYFQVQDKVSSTNKFLVCLFLKSIITSMPKDSIIHAHRPDHLAAFLFFNRRPSVISLHGQQAHTVNIRKGILVRTIYHILEKYAFKKAKALIAVDPITFKFYAGLYPEYQQKMYTIPTGVNTDSFKPISKDISKKLLGFDIKEKVIIYVGRIEPPKRLDIVLKAFQIVLKKDTDYRLLVVGDGVLMPEIKTLSSKLKLDKKVSFLGVRKRNELAALFNVANVSILISGNEGSPLSVKESLACGIPVIANDVGDISLIVKDSFNGYIVDKENIQDIANKLLLAGREAEKMKQNCIDSSQKYTIERVSQEVIDVYKKISND